MQDHWSRQEAVITHVITRQRWTSLASQFKPPHSPHFRAYWDLVWRDESRWDKLIQCPPAGHWDFGSLNPTSGLGTPKLPVDHWPGHGRDPMAIQVIAEQGDLARLHGAWPHFKINLGLGRDSFFNSKQILVKYPKFHTGFVIVKSL